MSIFRVIVNLFHFNRTNWKAVALCFLAALVFWFFNALNKDYSTNLRFAVNFEYDQDRFVPVAPLPKSVFMNVTGNGWDLFRKSLGVNLPDMNIPLERPTEVKKIVGSTLPALLAGQLGSLRINHVVTDTLYLSLDPKIRRKVKVAVDVEKFSFEEGHGRLSPVVLLPDSVELEGPRSLIEKIPSPIMLEISNKKIDRDFREDIEVIVPQGDKIKRNPSTVEVIFEVVEWLQVEQRLKLQLENLPSGARLSMVMDSVRCVFLIPRNQTNDTSQVAGGRVARIDLTGVRRGSSKLLPTAVGLPNNARVLHIDSVSIKLY